MSEIVFDEKTQMPVPPEGKIWVVRKREWADPEWPMLFWFKHLTVGLASDYGYITPTLYTIDPLAFAFNNQRSVTRAAYKVLRRLERKAEKRAAYVAKIDARAERDKNRAKVNPKAAKVEAKSKARQERSAEREKARAKRFEERYPLIGTYKPKVEAK